MENPTYIALSRARTIARDMTSVANNIANASTNGFRAERTLFQEHLAKTGPVGQRERISFVDDVGLYRDTREGPLEVTNNTLDLAKQFSDKIYDFSSLYISSIEFLDLKKK